jgi:glycerate kinase
MRILLAFDSFKGSLSATRAGEVAANAIAAQRPDATTIALPVADGGEGTVDAFLTARPGGERITLRVAGPLPGQTVDAAYAWFPADRLAVIEMAAASGLPLVPDARRNPDITTTRGTGELLADAFSRHPARVLLGVGGSATIDGGTGAARALGWRFLNARSEPIPEGGGGLATLARILPPAPTPYPPVQVLVDVTNPLTGPRGAAAVFGPQKGATPDQVARLDAGLTHLAALVRDQLHLDIATPPGAGAAGGLGGGALAWFTATLTPGIDAVLDAVDFDAACRTADWIYTGEGRLDDQSLHGKVLSGIIRRARAANPSIRIAAFAGRVDLAPETARAAGLDHAIAINPHHQPFAQTPALLHQAIHTHLTTLSEHK